MNRDPIEAVAALDEPVRRRLYDYVVAAHDAVGRDQAAADLSIGRSLAAFHLDRLADEGLLSVEFRRLSGRSGRGAGRPNKLYRRSHLELSVDLPPRRYALAGGLMAEAIEELGAPALAALEGVAHAQGVALGRSAGAQAADSADPFFDTSVALDTLGYEPLSEGRGELRLANCPFHELAAAHREATCGMNLAMMQGLLEGLGATQLSARLEPGDGWCCVRISHAEASTTPS